MKVLHIVSNISIRSGVMSILMNYYRHIDNSKIQFDFMFFDDKDITYEAEIKKLGGEIIKISRPTNIIKFFKQLKVFSKKNYGKYDILHIHEIFLMIFFANLKKKAGINKIIAHSHVTRFSDHKLRSIRNYIFSQVNRFIPDYYLACSRAAGCHAFGKKFNDIGIVINNAIDLSKFFINKELNKSIKKELNLEDKFVIGHIGNFTPQKNHLFLISIFEQVVKANSNAILVLIGDGVDREDVLSECKNKGLDSNILYLGTRNDVNRIMHCFDKFLFPSVYEGLGIVLIEAQATGIPCIFSDVVPEEANIIKEANKILNLNDDIEEWKKAVCENIEIDVETIPERIKLSGYSIDEEALRLQNFYENIL